MLFVWKKLAVSSVSDNIETGVTGIRCMLGAALKDRLAETVSLLKRERVLFRKVAHFKSEGLVGKLVG